jgi:UDP-glucose 4-epimerase
VGRAVVQAFLAEGHQVTAVARSEKNFPEQWRGRVSFRSLDLVEASEAAVQEVVDGQQVVVHLMALVHRPDIQDDASHQRVTLEPTKKLLNAALSERIESFIYMSSIAAIGTAAGEPVSEQTPARPQNAYGRTKLEAERVVAEALESSGIGWFIIRPPVVYGRGAEGNLLRMVSWLDRGRPVPCIRPGNARSMISDRNLASLVYTAAAAGNDLSGVYHAADDESWSFEEVAEVLSKVRNVQLRRIPVPRVVFAGFPRRSREHS